MKIERLQVLVTGGASGLGHATAKVLKSSGCEVAILDHHPKVKEIAQQLDVLGFQADVTDSLSIEQAFLHLSKAFKTLRVCINCAGIAPAKKIVSQSGVMPLIDFEKVIAVNLNGTFNVMRKAVEIMQSLPTCTQDGERGIIINTASIAAFEGQIGQTAYAASKGGVVAMTLPAARELASLGIRVNTIAPGLVATPMLLDMPPTVQARLSQQVPFPPRFAKPEEYAALVVHLIENTMINGEVIRLDGAMRMQAR